MNVLSQHRTLAALRELAVAIDFAFPRLPERRRIFNWRYDA